MRHKVSTLSVVPMLLLLSRGPPSRALDRVDAPDAAGLVPLARSPLSFNACGAGAGLAAINLAMVTAAAEHGAFATPGTHQHTTDRFHHAGPAQQTIRVVRQVPLFLGHRRSRKWLREVRCSYRLRLREHLGPKR